MRRTLILGGIGEARRLANALAASGWPVIYSVAGITAPANGECPVRRGGFGGAGGLLAYLLAERIELLVDATHPYAERISRHAAEAAHRAGVPLWAYRRPAWSSIGGDDWRQCAGWEAIVDASRTYRRPFFTVGRTPLENLEAMGEEQHWLVRSLAPRWPRHPRLTSLVARGPFTDSDETLLMREHGIDVLVSKNSGGDAVAAKLAAARRLGVPVLMWARPPLPNADRSFRRVEDLLAGIETSC